MIVIFRFWVLIFKNIPPLSHTFNLNFWNIQNFPWHIEDMFSTVLSIKPRNKNIKTKAKN